MIDRASLSRSSRVVLRLFQAVIVGGGTLATTALVVGYWEYREAGTAGSNGMALPIVAAVALVLQVGGAVVLGVLGVRGDWSVKRSAMTNLAYGVGAVVALLLLEGMRLRGYPGDGPTSWWGFVAYLVGRDPG